MGVIKDSQLPYEDLGQKVDAVHQEYVQVFSANRITPTQIIKEDSRM